MTGHRLAIAALCFVVATTTIGLGAIMADQDILPPAWGLVEAPISNLEFPRISTLAWSTDPFQMDRLASWCSYVAGMGPPPPATYEADSSPGLFGSLVDYVAGNLAQLLPWQGADAATFNSAGTGDWNADGTWTEVGQPGTGDYAIIANTHTVTLTVAQTSGSVYIASGGTLAGGGYLLTLDDGGAGDIFNHDGAISGTLNVKITGTTSRNIDLDGTGNVNNLEIDSTATFTLTAAVTLDGNLVITDGGLNTNAASDYSLTVATGVTIGDGAGAGSSAQLLAQDSALDFNCPLTIDTDGHLSAPTASGSFNFAGSPWMDKGAVTHNSGEVIIDGGASVTMNNNAAASTTFYDLTLNGGWVTLYGDITVENDLTTTVRTFSVRPISRAVTVTLGTAGAPGAIVNNDAIGFLSNTGNTATFTAASASFPFTVTGNDINWGAGGAGSKVDIRWVDYQITAATGGAGVTVKLTGAAEFDALTVTASDTLDLNGQEMTYSGALSTPGTFTGSQTSILTQTGVAATWTQQQTLTLEDMTVTGTHTTGGFALDVDDIIVTSTGTFNLTGTLTTEDFWVNGGSLAAGAGATISFTATDGFGDSSGNLTASGTSGSHVTISRAGGTWDGDASLTLDLTYTDINGTSTWGTDTNATNLSFVTLTNVIAIKGDGVVLEWLNSTFNPEAITIPNTGRQISRDHNVSTDWLWWGIGNLSDLSAAALPDGNSTIILQEGNLTADLNASAYNLTVSNETVWIQGPDVYSYYSTSGGVYVVSGGLWNLTGNATNYTFSDRLTNQSAGQWTLTADDCDLGVITDYATLLNCNNGCASALPFFVNIGGDPEDRVYYSPDDLVEKGTEVTLQIFVNDPDTLAAGLTAYLNWHRVGSVVWQNFTMTPGLAPPPGVLAEWNFPQTKDIVVVYEFNITVTDGTSWIYTANRTIEWVQEGEVDGGGPGGLGGQDPGGGTATGAVTEGGVSALICLPIIIIVILAAARLTGTRRRTSP